LSATKQVVANIFSDGEIHYNEILLPAGESQDGLDSELRIVRELRLTIQGLPNADGVADDALDGHAPTLPFIASGAVVYDLTVVNVP
jgi:hypothetical protein